MNLVYLINYLYGILILYLNELICYWKTIINEKIVLNYFKQSENYYFKMTKIQTQIGIKLVNYFQIFYI